MGNLKSYDPTSLELSELEFGQYLRTATAQADHPSNEVSAIITRDFGRGVIEPTILEGGEELDKTEAPEVDQFRNHIGSFDKHFEQDGTVAVLKSEIDGANYEVRLPVVADYIHDIGENSDQDEVERPIHTGSRL